MLALRRTAPLVVLGLALPALLSTAALTGCGDDDGDQTSYEPPTVTAAPYADVQAGCLTESFCQDVDDWVFCAMDAGEAFEKAPDALRQAMNDYYQCAAESADCTELAACHGTDCDAQTDAATCEGNTLQTCYQGHRVSIECGAPLTAGETCMTSEAGAGFCADRACTASEQERISWCQGEVSLTCAGGYLKKTVCPIQAASLCSAGDYLAPCTVSTGEACDPAEGVSHCEGSVQVGCDAGLSEVWRNDCSKLAFRTQCLETTDGAFCVEPFGAPPSCDPSEVAPACDGDVLQFCDGWQRSFDCAAIGLRCDLADPDGYRCVP